MNSYCRLGAVLSAVALFMLVTLCGTASAQTRYAYMPSGDVGDNRFLSITGSGINTLGDQTLSFKIASPPGNASFHFGIFDGENGGRNDLGTATLEYTLLADPDGNATGTHQVGQWLSTDMPDNAWFDVAINNVTQARNSTGDYNYLLRVRALDYTQTFWSNFKLRVSGSISALRLTNIAYTSPLNSASDALFVYPLYPLLDQTIYDGEWNFYMEVPAPQTELVFWDGDFDRGRFDCTDNDNDDPDTPNNVPPFATGASVVAEANPTGGVPCQDALGLPIQGTTTSNPPDDSRNPVFRRNPSITYEIIAPNGAVYANTNPSGNLEWEQFRISTEPFDRSKMDVHADMLPAGIYQIRIRGVDLANLNAVRVPFDLLGSDSLGDPIPMPRPYFIEGTVVNDQDNDKRRDESEPGLEGWRVVLNGDTILTDEDGHYRFAGLEAATYRITVIPPACRNVGGGDRCDRDKERCDHSRCGKYSCNHSRCDEDRCDHQRYYRIGCSPRPGCQNKKERSRYMNCKRDRDDDHNYGCDDNDNDNTICWVPTFDLDGVATANTTQVTLTQAQPSAVADFGYTEETNDDNNGNECEDNKTSEWWYKNQNKFPVSSLTLGNRSYSKSDIVKFLKNGGKSGDKTYTMAAELIAAKFNRLRGDNSAKTLEYIEKGDAWLRNEPVGSNVNACERAWKDKGKGKDIAHKLKERNRGNCNGRDDNGFN